MILIDTGFLIAWADGSDRLHGRARRWYATVNEPLILTEHVLFEFVNHFSTPVRRPRALAVIELARTEPQFEFLWSSSELVQSALQLHRARPDKEWSLTDCVSFVVMRRRGVTRALAYDHHFEQAGFEALLRREP